LIASAASPASVSSIPGIDSDCVSVGKTNWRERYQHVEACCAASAFPHPPPPAIRYRDVTKQQEIDALPEELLRLVWSCRHPILTEQGYRRCGKCHTCKTLAETNYSELVEA
jgi:hypothetical protein